MEYQFRNGQRVRQKSTNKIGFVSKPDEYSDEHSPIVTRFYHVKFEGETEWSQVAESDLVAVGYEKLG